MQTYDWIWLLHPIIAVAIVYPLLGIVLNLSLKTRNRRLKHQNENPATIGNEHRNIGRWLSAGVITIVLIALVVMISTEHPPKEFEGGVVRAGQLFLVLLGSCLTLLKTWQAQSPFYRASFALLCWAGIIFLGMQPEIFRLSDNPLEAEFWQSHFWGGIGLVGLMLFSLASQQEILRNLRWRWLHITANSIATLIFFAEAITGPKALLEIPLNWEKPYIQQAKAERIASHFSISNQP